MLGILFLLMLTDSQVLTCTYENPLGKVFVIVKKLTEYPNISQTLKRFGLCPGDMVAVSVQNKGQEPQEFSTYYVGLRTKKGRNYLSVFSVGTYAKSFSRYFTIEEQILMYGEMSITPGGKNVRVGCFPGYWKDVVGGVVGKNEMKVVETKAKKSRSKTRQRRKR